MCPVCVLRVLVSGHGGGRLLGPGTRLPPPPPWGPSAHFYWGGGVAYRSEETSPPCVWSWSVLQFALRDLKIALANTPSVHPRFLLQECVCFCVSVCMPVCLCVYLSVWS